MKDNRCKNCRHFEPGTTRFTPWVSSRQPQGVLVHMARSQDGRPESIFRVLQTVALEQSGARLCGEKRERKSGESICIRPGSFTPR